MDEIMHQHELLAPQVPNGIVELFTTVVVLVLVILIGAIGLSTIDSSNPQTSYQGGQGAAQPTYQASPSATPFATSYTLLGSQLGATDPSAATDCRVFAESTDNKCYCRCFESNGWRVTNSVAQQEWIYGCEVDPAHPIDSGCALNNDFCLPGAAIQDRTQQFRLFDGFFVQPPTN
ncbi:MAG: hypothetical protein IPJ88_18900 [Myxococcales bacterium]|nr:MAG: hypothetical protein IPJ88_18900 [Myxococcales bacterium]